MLFRSTDIDVEMLVRGIRDGLSANGAAMLMSDKEVRAVMGRVQQEVRKNMVLNRREQGERARVEGIALVKRHLKKSQEHPQGTIAEREGSIHVSNLMLQSVHDASTRRKKAPAAV